MEKDTGEMTSKHFNTVKYISFSVIISHKQWEFIFHIAARTTTKYVLYSYIARCHYKHI